MIINATSLNDSIKGSISVNYKTLTVIERSPKYKPLDFDKRLNGWQTGFYGKNPVILNYFLKDYEVEIHG